MTSDQKTVADLQAFLGQFFGLHPHLRANEFYMAGVAPMADVSPMAAMSLLCLGAALPGLLSTSGLAVPAAGESYAGVYVPLLAQSVLKSNAAPASVHKINLKVLKHAHWAADAGGCACAAACAHALTALMRACRATWSATPPPTVRASMTPSRTLRCTKPSSGGRSLRSWWLHATTCSTTSRLVRAACVARVVTGR